MDDTPPILQMKPKYFCDRRWFIALVMYFGVETFAGAVLLVEPWRRHLTPSNQNTRLANQ